MQNKKNEFQNVPESNIMGSHICPTRQLHPATNISTKLKRKHVKQGEFLSLLHVK
jgi:hypothetical protein